MSYSLSEAFRELNSKEIKSVRSNSRKTTLKEAKERDTLDFTSVDGESINLNELKIFLAKHEETEDKLFDPRNEEEDYAYWYNHSLIMEYETMGAAWAIYFGFSLDTSWAMYDTSTSELTSFGDDFKKGGSYRKMMDEILKLAKDENVGEVYIENRSFADILEDEGYFGESLKKSQIKGKKIKEDFKNWNSNGEYELDLEEVKDFLANHRDTDPYAKNAYWNNHSLFMEINVHAATWEVIFGFDLEKGYCMWDMSANETTVFKSYDKMIKEILNTISDNNVGEIEINDKPLIYYVNDDFDESLSKYKRLQESVKEDEKEEAKEKEKEEKDKELPFELRVEDYQKWVDYDMEHYGEISERTNELISKAGFQIVKDDHGDYEVVAGHFE